RFEETVCCLSALCDLSLGMTETLMLGERTDPVLILARAAGLDWETTELVLKVKPTGGQLSPTMLGRARENFDRLRANIAERVLKYWRLKEP
ncbi:DUF2336 domain-containing protein, partial [Escherichia coli]|uniref:DUF2336 domain-containing protein n=1 Tax=Escherichia coli TaxID=562 RepID=UPI0019D5EFFA